MSPTIDHTDTEWREIAERGREQRELRARLAAGANVTAGAQELANRIAIRTIASSTHHADEVSPRS